MRTTLLYSLVALGALLLWIFAARSVSLFLDTLQTKPIGATPVSKLRFDNGTLEFAGIRLDSFTPATVLTDLKVMLSPRGRATLSFGAAQFPCGPGHSNFPPSGLPDIDFTPDPGDTVTYTTERSHLSWPTPFQMNFMTGVSPSWKRHLYSRLQWTKRSHARLEILWRYEQGYFSDGGWRPEKIEFGTGGLLHVRITETKDLYEAAVRYLATTKQWAPATYHLEDRGPSADGAHEILAALHHADATAQQPGSGRSVQLLLDSRTRQVTGEFGFQ
ncbi:hypothetical protein [Bryobacter aggregatus]|uniref:hypothetical protein n=1 Tax=Bryobacter aggregatus TaxID=360054 RepID=UPI0012BA59DF|nr:hypothetical protein [Bryobacter aggregatus]